MQSSWIWLGAKMSKFTDQARAKLRKYGTYSYARFDIEHALDLLDEAEKALADARETIAGLVNSRSFEGEGSADEWAAEIDTTLARIRGEQ